MRHPSNLSIDFITLQELKLQNLLSSRGLMKPSGYFIKIRTLTCNCCSVECYSLVCTEKAVKHVDFLDCKNTFKLCCIRFTFTLIQPRFRS